MLDVRMIERRFGERIVLHDVSFSIADGEVVGFVGVNGAGKTTTMRIIMGLLEANAGSVHWNGEPIDDSARHSFGYMPEERGLYPKMRVVDQLQYLAELAGYSRRDAKASSMELLQRLGLVDRANELLEKLSLGNQQRVQLAVALVGNPRLLVLDEPFSGLDPIGVDALTGLLEERISQGVGMLFSSHQLDLVQRLADRVVMIHEGHIALNETVGNTFDHAKHVGELLSNGSVERPGSLADRFRAITTGSRSGLKS